MTGYIKKMMRDKGFGFIKTVDGEEYFFHRSACVPPTLFDNDLDEGVGVKFETETGPKGLRARDVTRS